MTAAVSLRRWFLIALITAAPLSAQENLFRQVPPKTHDRDQTSVEFTALFSVAPPTGYLPVRVTVVNHRTSDGEIRVRTISSTGSGDDNSLLSSEFTINSAKESSSTHDLLVPVTTVLDSSRYRSGSEVRVNMSGSFGSSSGELNCTYADTCAAVMMSEKLYTLNASMLDAEVSKRTGNATFAGKFDPAIMPEDWRAYSGYDAFLMTAEDWLATSAGARNALLQWCRLGGEITIYQTEGSTGFKLPGLEFDPGGREAGYGYGSIAVLPISDTFGLDHVATVGRYLNSRSKSSLNQSIRDDYSSSWPLHLSFGQQKFSYGIFVIVLVAFGILVGPVNLFVFAKSGMRHKLFITTPIISLGTSALLIVLILLKDGTGGRGERIALIEVRPDSGENNAYVHQEQVSRTGVLLGGSFDLDESAAITPVPIAGSPWARLTAGSSGGGMRYSARLEDGKLKTTGDWFQSRSEQGQLIRAVVPTRGRIELKGNSGAPVLLSTFEFPIETIYYMDRSGGCWISRDLKPGMNSTCSTISRGDYDSAIRDQSLKLAERNRRHLVAASGREDHYVAVTDEAPAIDSLDAISWKNTRTILTGPTLR